VRRVTAAATPAKSSAKTHREHGRCLACNQPYRVNVRQGYYVKCPKCGAANPGSLVAATIAKANTKPKPLTPATGRGAAPAVTPSAPSPAPPRKPKVQLAKPTAPKKPATAAAPSSVPATPPTPATPPKRGFFSRLIGDVDDDD
jgi:hypothetical protein